MKSEYQNSHWIPWNEWRKIGKNALSKFVAKWGKFDNALRENAQAEQNQNLVDCRLRNNLHDAEIRASLSFFISEKLGVKNAKNRDQKSARKSNEMRAMPTRINRKWQKLYGSTFKTGSMQWCNPHLSFIFCFQMVCN